MSEIEGFYTGNVIKYICRWKKKNDLEDLKKARVYLNWLIDHEEKKDQQARDWRDICEARIKTLTEIENEKENKEDEK